MSESLSGIAARDLAAVRKRCPLVHNITNFVVMNPTANALLALGASPVMAHAAEEVEEMAAIAGAVVLNIGTLDPTWVASMIRAGKKANSLSRPVVLDPVGAGATTLRTEAARRIVSEVRVAVVRGNASEIMALGTGRGATRGVDSAHGVEEALEAARGLALELGTVLAVTGPVDRVTDGRRLLAVENGHPLMARITGSGCMATAVTGAFLAVNENALEAAAGALALFGLSGQRAAAHVNTPGRFTAALIDALFTLDPETLQREARIVETDPPDLSGA
jgi:hydroxyethylthiazole kinase